MAERISSDASWPILEVAHTVSNGSWLIGGSRTWEQLPSFEEEHHLHKKDFAKLERSDFGAVPIEWSMSAYGIIIVSVQNEMGFLLCP